MSCLRICNLAGWLAVVRNALTDFLLLKKKQSLVCHLLVIRNEDNLVYVNVKKVVAPSFGQCSVD
jgi:hypothetical protein